MKSVSQFLFSCLLLFCFATIVLASSTTSANANTSFKYSSLKQSKISNSFQLISDFDIMDIDPEEDLSFKKKITIGSYYKLKSISSTVFGNLYQFFTITPKQISSCATIALNKFRQNGSTPFYISLRVLRI
ncbi:MAG: hypothetical protein FGM16_03070 [Flavobacterium sp.]|nr:hypothetical protein [Flavobacterium sp.]